MNKEELDKEAEDYANGYATPDIEPTLRAHLYECAKDAYLVCAEPREKKIADLEETNAELQAKIDDWQSEYIELENIKNNEIAELKDKLNNLASVAEVRLANWQTYEKENTELEDNFKIAKDNEHEYSCLLTKAKELLTRFVMASVFFNGEKDLVEQAEQLLKE